MTIEKLITEINEMRLRIKNVSQNKKNYTTPHYDMDNGIIHKLKYKGCFRNEWVYIWNSGESNFMNTHNGNMWPN